MAESYWIPESPTFNGLYANLTGHDLSYGKLQSGIPQPSTLDVYSARKFITKEECDAWCAANPVPAFVPRNHIFTDRK